MWAVLHRFGSTDLRRDLPYKEPEDYRPPHPRVLREPWRKARARYEIPEVSPAPAPPPAEVPPAGLILD
jgi:hypothetical protein